jgi:hypothetical protein
MTLINELQLQDSTGSYEKVEISVSSKTAMVYKLAQVPPEIWMTLSTESKKWLLNERKFQQQQNDKMKSHQAKRILSKLLKRIGPIHLICQINMQKSKILQKGRKNFKMIQNRIMVSLMNSLKRRLILPIFMHHIRKRTVIIGSQSRT